MDILARWQGPFILAVIFSLFLPDIPPLFLLISAFCLSLGLIYYRALVISGFLCGFSLFFLHAHLATSWQLPAHLIKQPIEIVGYVAQIPHIEGDNTKFILTIAQIGGVKRQNLQNWHWRQQVNVKLNWRMPENSQLTLKQGQYISLTSKLKPAHGFANLGGFSYSKWLLLKGIRATGYVYNKLPITIISNQPTLRQQLFDQQITHTADLNFKGILLALTMGEKQLIDKPRWQAIRATGIGHLLAISGLHVGMMFMFCHFLGFWLASLFTLITKLRFNTPVIAVMTGLVGALVYSWMAGFAVTTVRALLMLFIGATVIYFARGRNGKSILLTTLTVILLLDPLAILSAGLWLSFIAVVSILTMFWLWPDNSKNELTLVIYAKAILKIQLVLFVCLLPLTALIFNGVSLSGSWVNLIAVPWVSFITVPLALIATFIGLIGIDTSALWLLADKSLELLFVFINQPYNLSGWTNTGFMPWHVWLGLFVVLLTLILPIKRVHKFAGGCLLLVALGYTFDSNDNDSWRVDVLDVGQGLAVVIEYQQQWIVYDLGPVYPSGFNTAEQVVRPYLAYHGVSNVDWLVLSHADSDHAGDYQYFLQQFGVNLLIAPKELKLDGQFKAKACQPQQVNWQGLIIEVFWPTHFDDKRKQKLSRNDSSCVMRISNHHGSLLLTGDISKRAEKQLVKAHHTGAINLTADIMLAPHHGSMSSSSSKFIKAVNPKFVAFSSGFLNRYRFPRPEVVSRYNARGALHHTTSTSGQISYRIDSKGINVEQIRYSKQNLWYLNR